MNGEIDLSGQALDNFLVQEEQLHVQSFTLDRYPGGVPGHVFVPVSSAFSVGRYVLPQNMRAGINFVESFYGENFNFWDTSHRISVGESMMSVARNGTGTGQ